MIKYLATAVVLKCFSMNSITRKIYRQLGNAVAQKKRGNQDLDSYIERGDILVSLCKKYGVLKDGNHFLELGTGWLHWFGIYTRLHADIKVDLYDVWDNRQFDALKASFRNLRKTFDDNNRITDAQRDIFDLVEASCSNTDLYNKLNLAYTINPEGDLSGYESKSFDCVFSFHVMEHIGRSFISESIKDMYRILKPGAYCIHQIGIDDHLSHYDTKESPKNYLRYSLKMRKMIFENIVQYHNVCQGQEYIDMFSDAGFDIAEISRDKCDISDLKIHSDWSDFSQDDLETTIFTIVCHKPEI